jgi:hypothetical protein
MFARGAPDFCKAVTTSGANARFRCGGSFMPKKALWLIIIFTILFILGINIGELEYLMNLGNTI